MIDGFFLQLFSLFYIIFLMVVFFSKKRLKSEETKIYVGLMVTNLIGIILHITSFITIANMESMPLLNTIITKMYLVYLLVWLILITYYIISITFANIKWQKIYKIGIFIIAIPVLCLLVYNPLYYHYFGSKIYSYGAGTDLLYISSFILSLFWLICIFCQKKKTKKIIPLLILIAGGLGIMLIQRFYPYVLLLTSLETFVTIIMYFTIENPDMKMIEQLDIAKHEAEQANQAKTDFLSNMSHEIRTPLNAIVGFSQALETEDIPESSKEEVKDIITASNGLLEIVNGILDISKIEANKLEIINTDYSFKKIFNELVVLTKIRMGETNTEFRYSMDASIPGVLYGDHSRLKQVILNILTNAVKYTKTGYIDFRVSSVIQGEVCRLIISVEDSGIGIKNENIDKLFTKFERLGVEKAITIEGTGLGLAITKRLVELMKGSIVVQSIYGEGSKFTVAIDQKIDFTVKLEELEAASASNDLSIIDCTGKRILIVDDNKINLKVATRLLSDYHITIDTVMSGQECIDKYTSGINYDLIFMDDMMPKMSGVETFTKLKELGNYNIPTIALTANAISGMKEKYIKDGFDDYLAKPIEKPELNRIIVKFLGQK